MCHPNPPQVCGRWRRSAWPLFPSLVYVFQQLLQPASIQSLSPQRNWAISTQKRHDCIAQANVAEFAVRLCAVANKISYLNLVVWFRLWCPVEYGIGSNITLLWCALKFCKGRVFVSLQCTVCKSILPLPCPCVPSTSGEEKTETQGKGLPVQEFLFHLHFNLTACPKLKFHLRRDTQVCLSWILLRGQCIWKPNALAKIANSLPRSVLSHQLPLEETISLLSAMLENGGKEKVVPAENSENHWSHPQQSPSSVNWPFRTMCMTCQQVSSHFPPPQ